jgi:hypothetical protein
MLFLVMRVLEKSRTLSDGRVFPRIWYRELSPGVECVCQGRSVSFAAVSRFNVVLWNY